MDMQEVIKTLSSLMQLDIDAAHAYGQAIQEITARGVRQQIEIFRGDHERHITSLSSMIRQLGGTPPEHSRDFKGYLIEGFTAIRSATGTEGALKAMETNENLTNRKYSDAVHKDLPQEAKSLVEQHYADERHHLKYIQEALANRVWEKEEIPA